MQNWKRVNKSPTRELPFKRDLLSYFKKSYLEWYIKDFSSLFTFHYKHYILK